jgi:2,3-bisphosphoglycerate-dependent phosphoglycerate mutase
MMAKTPGVRRTTAPRAARSAFAALAASVALTACAALSAPSIEPAPGPLTAQAAGSVSRATAGDPQRVIFLVRHAEAESDPGGDPPLTPAGVLRAERLASVLMDAGVEVIHSSRYRRTEATAAPLAAALGLEPVPYDARDLPGLAARLRSSTGRHLVVGHSNTTGEVVELLGGDRGSAIQSTEHDRLYLVVVEDGVVRTVLLRY